MMTAFEVAAVFGIKDEATTPLRRLAEQVRAFDKLVLDATKHLAALGEVKFPGLGGEFKALSDQIETLTKTFGAAIATIDSGITSATGEVRTFAAQWANVTREINATSAAMRGINLAGTPGLNPRARIPGPHGGGSSSGLHVSPLGVPLPGTHASVRGGNAAMIGAGAIAYGMYEEAELEKDAARAVWIAHAGNLPDVSKQAAERKQYRDIIKDVAAKTGKSFKELSEAGLIEIRQGSGFSWEQRMAGMPGLLTTAAAEADIKGTSIHEAADSLVAFAHMLKVYDPIEMQKLYPGLSYLSIRSPATLKRITTSAGYHIPATTAGLEVDPIEEMILQTGLERAGIFNTKSGTWLREMALRALPPLEDKTKPAIYAQKMDALRELGLVDQAGKPTWFTGGKPDELKMLEIVAEHAKGIPVERRALLERYLFGAQGGGAVGVLSDPRLLPQLNTMEKEARDYRQGTEYFEYMYANSPVQKFNQAWVDTQIVLMDIGEKVLPPVVGLLQAFDAGLKGLESTLGGGAIGTIVAAGLGAMAGARVAGVPGAIVGGVVGAAAANKPSADLMPSATWGDWWSNIKNNPAQLFGLGTPTLDLGGAQRGGDVGLPAAIPQRYEGPSFDLPPIRKASYEPGSASRMQWQPPPQQRAQPINIHVATNLDGRTLAEAMSEKIAELYTYPSSSATHEGQLAWNPPDWQTIAT